MLQQIKNFFHNPDKNEIKSSWTLCCKILKYCRNDFYKVKRSPPYLPDILPDIHDNLLLICSTYKNDPKQIEYFSLFMDNFMCKCERVLRLFREGKAEMCDEKSAYRRSFAKLSLGLNSMQKELKAIFPEGHYVEDHFQITKKDARAFWKENFDGRTIVPWAEFKNALAEVHPIRTNLEALSLKKAIDLTTNDHVSIYEYDVFTRLFSPWSTLLVNWNLLAVVHPAHMAFLTYEEVKLHLEKHRNKPGSYVFRLSCTHLGKWAIGYVSEDGEILQTILENKSLAQHLYEGYQKKMYLYPDGEDNNPDMSRVACGLMTPRFSVSEEQYQQYCSIFSTFEVCKICYDNDKDIILEPCGHLICHSCYSKMQRTGSSRCSFCRSEVKEFENIIVNPFEPNDEEQDWVSYQQIQNDEQLVPDAQQHNSSIETVASNKYEECFDQQQGNIL